MAEHLPSMHKVLGSITNARGLRGTTKVTVREVARGGLGKEKACIQRVQRTSQQKEWCRGRTGEYEMWKVHKKGWARVKCALVLMLAAASNWRMAETYIHVLERLTIHVHGLDPPCPCP